MSEDLFFKRLYFTIDNIKVFIKLRYLDSVRTYKKDAKGYKLW